MPFNLISEFKPTGDQPEAISQLVQGITDERRYQVLLGVTGSGKTFTIANVIQQVERPTLVLSHNKTLAAQLYKEFKAFFPDNAVEYFVSYYDYYQPEAYLPTTDTYIEKELEINEEIDKLRLRTTASLLSGRRDVIVVSSVSCLYGMADPRAFGSNIIHLKTGMTINRNTLLRRLVDALYNNNEIEFKRGCFRAKGETVDIFPAIETFEGVAYRIEFWDDTIDRITSFDPATSKTSGRLDTLDIYPANLFVTDKETIARAIEEIKEDLKKQVAFFKDAGKMTEANRLEERVKYDLEMIRELGFCPGIENYSRYSSRIAILDAKKQKYAKHHCLLLIRDTLHKLYNHREEAVLYRRASPRPVFQKWIGCLPLISGYCTTVGRFQECQYRYAVLPAEVLCAHLATCPMVEPVRFEKVGQHHTGRGQYVHLFQSGENCPVIRKNTPP